MRTFAAMSVVRIETPLTLTEREILLEGGRRPSLVYTIKNTTVLHEGIALRHEVWTR
jgi:hypothetical protein